MKFKNLLITAALAICVQMAPPALAAPTGDWIDTSSMTPVYTAENLSVTASGAVEADVNITDFIIDFEVAMNGRYVVRRNIDGTVKNWIDIRQSWATEAREGSTTQGTGRHVQQVVNANGWFDRTNVDPDYPLYTTENIGFRLQTKNGTISLWAADLDAEGEPAYKYAGSYTHDNAKNKKGTLQIWCDTAQTIKSIKVYSLKGEMKTDAEISAKKGSVFDVEFSVEPEITLTEADFVLKNSEGNEVVGAIGTVSGDGCNYTITLGEWLEFGEEYTLSLVDGINTVQGFGIEGAMLTTEDAPRYKLEITDVAVSSEEVTVSATKNVNETISGVAVIGVYNVTDGVEECVKIIAQNITDETRDSFDLTFTQVQAGSVLRAYILTDLDTMKSMAMPQEN